MSYQKVFDLNLEKLLLTWGKPITNEAKLIAERGL
jgi:hypothetical protein